MVFFMCITRVKKSLIEKLLINVCYLINVRDSIKYQHCEPRIQYIFILQFTQFLLNILLFFSYFY